MNIQSLPQYFGGRQDTDSVSTFLQGGELEIPVIVNAGAVEGWFIVFTIILYYPTFHLYYNSQIEERVTEANGSALSVAGGQTKSHDRNMSMRHPIP